MDVYHSYIQALADADVGGAVSALDDGLGRGTTSRQLLQDVVARGQREAGDRWLNGSWSIADEHAATAVAEQAMAVVAPPHASMPAQRRVVLACAEGEWHTFAARLAAELARSPALDVSLLGGSVPAAHLQHRLRGTRPDALALSVTLPSHLVGASRSIAAAHAEGIPVVVGGAAWGDGVHASHRAGRLGADAHLADPVDLARVVEDLSGRQVEQGGEVPVEALRLDTLSPEVIQLAQERQAVAHPGTPGTGTPGSGTPGSGTPGSGTPGTGTPGSGTPGAGGTGGSTGGGAFSSTVPSGTPYAVIVLKRSGAAGGTGGAGSPDRPK